MVTTLKIKNIEYKFHRTNNNLQETAIRLRFVKTLQFKF